MGFELEDLGKPYRCQGFYHDAKKNVVKPFQNSKLIGQRKDLTKRK
jgi:hypothetical protein